MNERMIEPSGDYSGTSDKGHLCIKDSICIFPSKRGQSLYNGQNDLSQCVRYSGSLCPP